MNDYDIRGFLLEMKSLVVKSKRRFLKRNIDELGELGLTSNEAAWREVLRLNPKHLFREPTPDHYNDGTLVWEFKKEVNGILAYIKLKIDDRGCVCMSFHRDRPTS